MEDKFISLGGTLLLNSQVNSILIKNKKAYGVDLVDGTEILGDYVVTCCDANYALNRLLLGQYKLRTISSKVKNPLKNPTPTCCLLSFAINKDIDIPTPYSFGCEPFVLGGLKIEHITVRSYRYDDSFDKGNKTTMTVLLDQYNYNYDFYKKLAKNPNEYNQFKKDLANAIMGRIIKQAPAFKDNTELLDVATPLTLTKYTNVTKGAYMGFLFTHKKSMFAYNGHVPGLKNFYLSGQWLQGPGGLPIAMTQGKFAIQRICKKEKLNYVFSPKRIKKKQNI